MARISEQNLVLPALFLMRASENGFISTSDLKKELTELLNPKDEDAEPSPSRPNEIKFMQIVGNLKSHDTFEKNGFATYEKIGHIGGFRITQNGKYYLDENSSSIKYLINNNFHWEDLQDGLLELEKSKNEKRPIIFLDENILITEGSKKTHNTVVYERSSKLRQSALEHFSVNGRIDCKCCHFNFQDFYGTALGKDFIEIHHIKPIYTYADENIQVSIVDAMRNLIPVCSNCHRIIHRNTKEALGIPSLIDAIRAHGIYNRL